jgi:trk system potassium uptake protein TrkA
MKYVILGCGRVGSMLATQLCSAGHEVSIIDRNRDAFRRLSPAFTGQTIFGQGIDEDVLRRAGIEGAQGFVALTQGDNTNIMASQVVKVRFQVPRILCRVYDSNRAQVFREMGIDTIATARLISGVFGDLVQDNPLHSVYSYFGQPEPLAEEA